MSDLHFFVSNLMFGVDLHFSFAFFCIGFAACSAESWNRIFFAFLYKTFFSFFANLPFPSRTSGKAGKIQKTPGNLQKKCEKHAKQMQHNLQKRCNTSKKDIKTRNKNAVSACFCFGFFPIFSRFV